MKTPNRTRRLFDDWSKSQPESVLARTDTKASPVRGVSSKYEFQLTISKQGSKAF